MKLIHTQLNDYETKILSELTQQGGWRPSEAMRMGLRLLHAKTFPVYVNRKNRLESREETPEEKCMAHGGEIVIEDGVKRCKIMQGNLEVYNEL